MVQLKKSILVKKKKATSAGKITIIHDAENVGLVPKLELTSDKGATMDQELANCIKL